MKKLIKSFVFALFLTVSIFTVSSCDSNEVSMSEKADVTRSIETNEVNYNTYFAEFDDYSIERKDDSIEINVIETINVSDYEINNVSFSENDIIHTDFKVRFDATTNKVYLDCNIQVGDEVGSIETIEGLLVTLENGTIDTVFEIEDELVLLSDLNLDLEINQCGWFSNLVKKVTKGFAQACTTVANSLIKAAPYVAAVAVTAAVGASAVVTGGGSLALAPVAYSAVASLGIYAATTVGLAANGAFYNAVSDAIPEDTYDTSNDTNVDVDALIDKLLNGLSNDFGWTKEKLKSELEKALNKTVKGAAVGITIAELIKNTKIVVYLGRYEGGSYYGYVATALRNENAIYFSTPNWDALVDDYGEEGVWILNRLFLDVVMALDCEFELVSNPDLYFNYSTKTKIKTDGNYTSYSKELEHIYISGYRWNGGKNLTNIRATR